MNIVTGSAGFIGTRLYDALDYVVAIDKADGWDLANPPVTAFDFAPFSPPARVFHLASRVGMGESQYRPVEYCEDNVMGTAKFLSILAASDVEIEHMVLASSVSAMFGGSPYAATKACQEELCEAWCKLHGVTLSVLRLFNVYGPGQSLTNPYTGVAAIFAQRLLSHAPPVVFEDGLQTRDFVHVDDVVRAMVMAADARFDGIAEIGTGRPTPIIDVATALRDELGGPLPLITGDARKGDFRHAVADTTAAKVGFGWEPKIAFKDGVKDLAKSLRGQVAHADVDGAIEELRMAGGFVK